MDVKSYLISLGTDEATATAISENPQFAQVYEKAAAAAEEGKTAFLKAQEIERTMKTWNETQVIPYVQKADAEVARLKAEKAAMSTHMKSLKDLGYEIPDSYLEGGAPTPAAAATPAAANSKDYDDMILKSNLAQMEIADLKDEAQFLTGKRLSISKEYEAMKADGRPGENFRQYITRKYDLETIRNQREKEAEQKKLDEYAAAKIAAKEVEWKQKFGSNPETIVPRSSRFDTIAADRKAAGSVDDKGRPLWQTQAGRAIATQNRLAKYEGKIQ